MDVEKLLKKRQLNVQEQNALTEYNLFSIASYWRKNGLPEGLDKVFKSKGINSEKCIIVEYEQDFPGCSTDEGIVVTDNGRFIKFEMDLSENRDNLVELYIWDDITCKIEINRAKRGTGSTWGYLVFKVLKTLNFEA